MKIGIIVHSNTGNTLQVANKLKTQLSSKGYIVNLECIQALDEDSKSNENIELVHAPDITEYDVIILGAPVRAFSLSPVMMKYLNQLESMEDKKVGCFVTQFFPYTFMGGKRAISQMKEICESKSGSIFDLYIVNWSNLNRSKQINDLIERLAEIE